MLNQFLKNLQKGNLHARKTQSKKKANNLIVYNCQSGEYEKFSSKTGRLLGELIYQGFEQNPSPWFFLRFVEQADAQYLRSTYEHFLLFLNQLPPSQQKNHLLQLDIFINHPDNYCYRLLLEAQLLLADEQGQALLLSCKHEMISMYTQYQPCSYQMLDLCKGSRSYLPGHVPLENRILTKMEKEVLQRLKFGHNQQQIAQQLNISQHTVNNHCANINKKTRTANSTNASHYAVAIGDII